MSPKVKEDCAGWACRVARRTDRLATKRGCEWANEAPSTNALPRSDRPAAGLIRNMIVSPSVPGSAADWARFCDECSRLITRSWSESSRDGDLLTLSLGSGRFG